MHNIKTIVVEDEGPARRRLEKMVLDHPNLDLTLSLSSGQEAIVEIPRFQPDLILLDIQLKDKTAFEILDVISHKIKSKIIFITAYDNYAIKAFEVEAIDYLLKPFDAHRFNDAISRVIKTNASATYDNMLSYLANHRVEHISKISIPEGNKNHLFSPQEIKFISADKYYVNINTTTQNNLIRITLKKIYQLLPSEFMQINKSIIINKQFIKQIEYKSSSSKIVFSSGEIFYTSKTYNEKFLNSTK